MLSCHINCYPAVWYGALWLTLRTQHDHAQGKRTARNGSRRVARASSSIDDHYDDSLLQACARRREGGKGRGHSQQVGRARGQSISNKFRVFPIGSPILFLLDFPIRLRTIYGGFMVFVGGITLYIFEGLRTN